MFNAVKTTRIYCRPSCSARPKPENVITYPTREAAERDGFRACKRCRPDLGERLRFATARTPLGAVLVAAGDHGVRDVLLGASAADVERELHETHPDAFISRDPKLRRVAGGILGSPRVELDMRGTAFQLEVWRKLLEIPRGETRTYTELAAELGRPRSVRAVAHACASNRIGVLVPCHRVVRTDGSLAGYRWGLERKRRLLEVEGAAASAARMSASSVKRPGRRRASNRTLSVGRPERPRRHARTVDAQPLHLPHPAQQRRERQVVPDPHERRTRLQVVAGESQPAPELLLAAEKLRDLGCRARAARTAACRARTRARRHTRTS